MEELTFNQYSEAAASTQLPSATGLEYLALGLPDEAGEVAGKIKKYYRGDKTLNEMAPDIAKELGDVLWYVDRLADYFGYTLEDIAKLNNTKLSDRKAAGTIQGDGDNR